MADAVAALARKRVPLGFVAAAIAILLARPTWTTWRMGLAVALVGEALRLWAAGHLEKSREVTQSGPYRFTGHPLYLGSAIIAGGVVVAAASPWVAVTTCIYMAATLTAAIRTEEAFLRRTFGTAYDLYSRSQSGPVLRRFTLARVRQNREYRAVAGLACGFGLLALKILLI